MRLGVGLTAGRGRSTLAILLGSTSLSGIYARWSDTGSWDDTNLWSDRA